MRHIDEDTITQAVIAGHAAAGDARLRELMTSLVQHLHAFAREVQLTEAEWAAGLRFIADVLATGSRTRSNWRCCCRMRSGCPHQRPVSALGRRRSRPGTESALPAVFHSDGAAALLDANRSLLVRGSRCLLTAIC